MTDPRPPKASERDVLQFERVCPKCHRKLLITEFPLNRSRPGGRQGHCKPCHNQLHRDYYATEHGREAVRAAQRRSYERRKAAYEAAVAVLPAEDRARLGLD